MLHPSPNPFRPGWLSDALTAGALGLVLVGLGGALPWVQAAGLALLASALCIRCLDTNGSWRAVLFLPLAFWAVARSGPWSAPDSLPYVGAAAAFALGASARSVTWTAWAAGLTLAAGLAASAWQLWVSPGWLPLGRLQVPQYLGRASGLFGNPNQWAAVLLLVLPWLWTNVRAGDKPLLARAGLAYLALAGVIALVFTQSRAGLAAGAVILLVYALRTGRGRWLAAGALALLLLTFSLEPLRERVLHAFQAGGESARLVLWPAGLALWKAEPWAGLGPGGFPARFESQRPAGFADRAEWLHSEPLQLLVDLGVVGVLLAAIPVVMIWIRRKPRECVALRWGTGAFAVACCADFHLHVPGSAWLAAWLAGVAWVRPTHPPQVQPSLLSRLGLLAAVAIAGWATIRQAAWAEVENTRLHASEAWRLFLVKNPQTAEARLRLAQRQAATETLLARHPTAWPLHLDLAWLQLAQARLGHDRRQAGQIAERHARAAHLAAPAHVDPVLWLGVSLGLQGRQWEAWDTFQEALRRAPRSPQVWYYFAYYLADLPNRKREAKLAIENCLQLDPNYLDGQALQRQLSSAQ